MIKPGWDRKRGFGPWRQNWVSICSLHQIYRSDCELCQCGHWSNHWKWFFAHILFTISPNTWRKIANSKYGWLVL